MDKGNDKSFTLRNLIRKPDSSINTEVSSYKWFVLANVMLGTFMAVLDATIVNTGIPKIMASFGAGLDKIEWVITAYLLAMAIMLPTSAWLADRYGYKRFYFLGLLFFTTGSMLCGLSPNEDVLIASRVIQGLGAGAIQPLGMAIVTREFPVHQRGIALGFWGIAAAASISFGPLIGGYIIDNFTWKLIFEINVPVGLVTMLLTILIQREYTGATSRKFDVVGFISVIIFLPLTLYALSEGNAQTNSNGWHAPYILLCGAIALIALTVFITAEMTVKHPLIDLRLVAEHNFGLANLVLIFFSLGMFGSTFLMPVYLQNSMGYTAFQAGSVFLPVGIIQGFFAPISGRIADKIGAKFPVLIGVLLMALSFYLNSKLSYLTERHYIMMSLYIRGVGMGLMFTALSTIALVNIPREKMAQASSIMNSIRQLGGSLGVAILATILTSRMNYHTQEYGMQIDPGSQAYKQTVSNIAIQLEHNVGESPADARTLSRSAVISNMSTQAYIQGINDDFLLAGIMTLLGGIPILFMKSHRSKTEKPSSDERIPA